MAAATCQVHQFFAAKNIMDALYDISTGSPSSVKCALMKVGFVFNPTSALYDSYHDAAIETNGEISTTGGYTLGGVTVTGFTYTASTGLVNCDPVSFPAVGVAMDGAVAGVFWFDDAGSPGEAPVICCINFGGTYTTQPGTSFRIGLTNGLFQVVANPT